MHFTLHLTKACNCRCSYCYAPPRADEGMTEETARQVLEFTLRVNQDNSDSIGLVFFGGEPLLKRDLIRFIVAETQRIYREKKRHFHYKITTNGLLLDEDFLEFSLRHNILVGFSLDGIRQSHDRHRKLPDGRPTFDRAYPKFRRLLDARPYSSVFATVNPDTVEYLVDSVRFLIGEGCRYVILSLNYEAAWTEEDLAELERQYGRLAELYIEWSREDRKFYISPFEMKLASHIAGEHAVKDHCELGVRQVSIDPEGYIFPCVQFPATGPQSRFCLGHVRTGIDETVRQRLRDESHAEKQVCRKCALSRRCHNTCGCLNWQTTRTLTQVSPVHCRHEQMLIALADRIGATLYAERSPIFLHKHYNTAYPILSLLEDQMRGSPAAEESATTGNSENERPIAGG
ncbi:MAG: radical SAM protein [Pirellulales bacterium]|nr:radical SAM protein [Pirellulales bacterium]